MEFDRLKNIWKMADNTLSQQNKLSIDQINTYKLKRSKSVLGKIKQGLIFNATLIGLIIIALGYDVYLFRTSIGVIVFCLIALLIMLMLFNEHYKNLKILRDFDTVTENLHDIINKKVNYFKTTYQKLLSFMPTMYVIGVAAANLIYFYNEYGGLRPFDLEDYLVFGGSFIFIYVATYFMLRMTVSNYVKEFETYLAELDSDALEEIEKNAKKLMRLRILMASIGGVFLILGIVVYFIFKTKMGV